MIIFGLSFLACSKHFLVAKTDFSFNLNFDIFLKSLYDKLDIGSSNNFTLILDLSKKSLISFIHSVLPVLGKPHNSTTYGS